MTAKQTKQTQKLVQGVGINDLDGQTIQNGKQTKVYAVWRSMLRRCYSEKSLSKHPTYRGCSVCDEWLSLSAFEEWFNANYRTGMELDKDILIPSNKVYSPEACRFVPGYINSLLCDSGAIRGELPLGVSARTPNATIGRVNTTYKAQCNNRHGRMLHKTFKTVAEAATWYSMTKTRIAGEQAIRAFEAGDINGDVYQALITREW